MRSLLLALAVTPALALAAPQQAAGAPPPGDPASADARVKRLRLARAVGLAEALDLDEPGALRARDVLARFDEKKAPLRKQVRDDLRTLRDAARGDTAAGAHVDAALKRLRDAREKLGALDAERRAELTKGSTPEKRARAALFLARFRAAAVRMGRGAGRPWRGGERGRGGPGRLGGPDDPAVPPGPPQPGRGGGPGHGPGMGPPPGYGPSDRDALSRYETPELEADDWFSGE